jgi:ribosomal protein S6--L-glutamate ligase
LRVALLSRNPLGWGTRSLEGEFALRGDSAKVIPLRAVRMSFLPLPMIVGGDYDLVEGFDAIALRVLGPGSSEEILQTMSLMKCLEARGQILVNRERSVTNCLNKSSVLSCLSASEVPIPRTHIVWRVEEGIRAFEGMGEVVIKPLYGSRGIGVVRATDISTARYALEEMISRGQVPLIQELLRHEGFDIRALVVEGSVVAAMKRVSEGFRTNISRGGRPIPHELNGELSELAVRASMALGCDYSGVDMVISEKGPFILEVNCQPDYRALQSVTGTNISSAIASMIAKRAAR